MDCVSPCIDNRKIDRLTEISLSFGFYDVGREVGQWGLGSARSHVLARFPDDDTHYTVDTCLVFIDYLFHERFGSLVPAGIDGNEFVRNVEFLSGRGAGRED